MRERQTERDRDRQTERQRDRETERRQTDRHRDYIMHCLWLILGIPRGFTSSEALQGMEAMPRWRLCRDGGYAEMEAMPRWRLRDYRVGPVKTRPLEGFKR